MRYLALTTTVLLALALGVHFSERAAADLDRPQPTRPEPAPPVEPEPAPTMTDEQVDTVVDNLLMTMVKKEAPALADAVSTRAKDVFWMMTATSEEQTALLCVFAAICEVESDFDPDAVNEGEDAVGIAQIRPIMIADANRLLKRTELKDIVLRERDRRNSFISWLVFKTYVQGYKLDDAEAIARCWNGGPNGMRKQATELYWLKVARIMATEERLVEASQRLSDVMTADTEEAKKILTRSL